MKYYNHSLYQEDLEKTFKNSQGIELLKGKSILVTGARGLIGSFLIELLIYCNEEQKFNCTIYVAGRKKEQLIERFGENVLKEYFHIVHYDMAHQISWEFDIDYIIHAAGNAYPKMFMAHPTKTIIDSVTGCYNLLNYASEHGCKKFVFVSSGEVYGMAQEGIEMFREDYQGTIDGLDSRACYPVSKRVGETICASYAEEFGLNTVIVRLCHIYGPTATNEDNRVIFQCINSALAGTDIVLKSDGKQRRSYCYIADCASGIVTALLKGEQREVYNIASPLSETTIYSMAEITAFFGKVKVCFDRPNKMEMTGFNPMDMAVLSSEKIKKLGWKSVYTLEQGLYNTLIIKRDCEACNEGR